MPGRACFICCARQRRRATNESQCLAARCAVETGGADHSGPNKPSLSLRRFDTMKRENFLFSTLVISVVLMLGAASIRTATAMVGLLT
jgi:hypothetical protein